MVETFDGGALVGAVDGLGHGDAAAGAGELAAATLRDHADEPLDLLVPRCHQALLATRGVAMSVASLDHSQSTLSWVGVGDVLGTLLHGGGGSDSRRSLISRGGVVGYRLPPLRPEVLPVAPGDLLIFSTDGVREGYADALRLIAEPQQLAEQILAEFGRGTDDALVLVARIGDGTAS